MSGVRLGRRRGVCTGLGKFAPLKNATWGNRSARCKSAPKVHLSRVPQCALPGTGIAPTPVADCRLCAPAHLLPQYCTLLGKTRHRHQPRTGRQLQTADCAPSAHLLPQYCTLLGKTRHRHRPRTGRRLQTVPPRTLPPRHRQFVPPARPTRYYQSTRPGVPPANSETPRPPKW